MRNHTLLVASAVLASVTLINAAEGGQRQRSPNRDGGGRQEQSGGSQGGSNAPRATPREDRGGDRGGSRDNGQRESAPPPQARSSAPAEAQAERSEPRARGRVEPRADMRTEPRPETRVEPRAVMRAEPQAQAPQAQASQAQASQAQASTGRQAVRRYPLPSDTRNNDARTDTRASDNRSVTGRTNDGRNSSVRYTDRTYSGRTYDNRNYSGGRVAVARPQYQHAVVRGDRYRDNYWYFPRTYYSPRYYAYRPYYYYRPSFVTAFSFGFGPYGRGYFYYDTFYNSYVFYPRTVVGYYGDSGYYGRPTGSLRLDIQPTDAQVYIDGAYAGLVDDFDGVFQSLRLEAGQYRVEVVLPGFETLAFEVYIQPGEKTTYRADMFPERP
jgi:hypothetical protein